MILVEGFKHEPISKIILYREEIGRPLEDMLDEFVIAVASDKSIAVKTRSLDLNQPESIADFITEWLKGAA
ncbi:Molybdopterin-guanine dinucleotide biosynthesis adapter protein [compost metagenome]